MADSKRRIRIFRFAKTPFGQALANYVNTVFPGENVQANQFNQQKPIEVDPDDASLVKVELIEEVF